MNYQEYIDNKIKMQNLLLEFVEHSNENDFNIKE